MHQTGGKRFAVGEPQEGRGFDVETSRDHDPQPVRVGQPEQGVLANERDPPQVHGFREVDRIAAGAKNIDGRRGHGGYFQMIALKSFVSIRDTLSRRRCSTVNRACVPYEDML
ncbi:MAG: hypothetical protein VW405_17065 [Rhodospirillaceae bacterium]